MTASAANQPVFISEKPDIRGSQPARRFKESCDQCGIAKVKCGKERPSCARCDARDIPCYYSPSQRAKRAKTSPIWTLGMAYAAESPPRATAVGGVAPSSCDLGNDYFSLAPQSWDDSLLVLMDIDVGESQATPKEGMPFGLDDIYNFVGVDQTGTTFRQDHFTEPSNTQSRVDLDAWDDFTQTRCASTRDVSFLDSTSRGRSLHAEPATRPAVQEAFDPSLGFQGEDGQPTPIPRSFEGINTLLKRSQSTCTESATPSPQTSVENSETSTHHVETAVESCDRLLLRTLQDIPVAAEDSECLSLMSGPNTNQRDELPTQKLICQSEFLAMNARAITGLRRVVLCSCKRSPDTQLLTSVAFCRILAWYKAVVPLPARGCRGSLQPQPLPSPPLHTPATQQLSPTSTACTGGQALRVSIWALGSSGAGGGTEEDTGGAERRQRAQLVLGRLQELAPLIREFAAKCEEGQDSTQNLGTRLKKMLKETTRAIISAL